jgi:hypothetical protein
MSTGGESKRGTKNGKNKSVATIPRCKERKQDESEGNNTRKGV